MVIGRGLIATEPYPAVRPSHVEFEICDEMDFGTGLGPHVSEWSLASEKEFALPDFLITIGRHRGIAVVRLIHDDERLVTLALGTPNSRQG